VRVAALRLSEQPLLDALARVKEGVPGSLGTDLWARLRTKYGMRYSSSARSSS
jgi:hypothetical protein